MPESQEIGDKDIAAFRSERPTEKISPKTPAKLPATHPPSLTDRFLTYIKKNFSGDRYGAPQPNWRIPEDLIGDDPLVPPGSAVRKNHVLQNELLVLEAAKSSSELVIGVRQDYGKVVPVWPPHPHPDPKITFVVLDQMVDAPGLKERPHFSRLSPGVSLVEFPDSCDLQSSLKILPVHENDMYARDPDKAIFNNSENRPGIEVHVVTPAGFMEKTDDSWAASSQLCDALKQGLWKEKITLFKQAAKAHALPAAVVGAVELAGTACLFSGWPPLMAVGAALDLSGVPLYALTFKDQNKKSTNKNPLIHIKNLIKGLSYLEAHRDNLIHSAN